MLPSLLVLNSLYPFSIPHAQAFQETESRLPQPTWDRPLSFPVELGTIQESFRGTDPRLVILIQDAHAVPDAQKSIRKIVDYFLEKHEVRLVALEGASGRLDPLLLRSFPDRKLLQKVISTYLDKGELSGAAAASFLSRPEADYYGVEDQTLYEKGIDAFLRALKMQPALLGPLEAEVRDLEVLKESAYSPALLEFDRILNAFHENSGHFPKLLRYLEIRARKHRKLSQRYPHLVSFLARKKRLAAKPSSRRPRQDILSEALLTKMKASAFFDEFDAFAKEIKKGLIQSPRESRLDQKDQRSRLLLKMVRFQLTREDWREVQSLRLPSDFQDFIRFYQISAARDATLVKNLLTLLEEKKANTAIVVAGGFHTAGFQEAFKRAGISYVLAAPRIEQVPKETHYLDLMQGQVSWSSYFKIKNGLINLYEAFNEATTDHLIPRGDPRNRLKPWRDRIIRTLADQGRMADAHVYNYFIDEAARKSIDPSQLEGFKRAWLEKVGHFTKDLLLHYNAMAIPYSIPHGHYPAGWLGRRQSRELHRSEVRDAATLPTMQSWAKENTPELLEYTFIERMMEMGLPNNILDRLKTQFGKRTADLVSMTTLTGGLGARTADSIEGMALNGFETFAIVPLYERIKGQHYLKGISPKEKFGDFLRKVLTKTDIHFSFQQKSGRTFQVDVYEGESDHGYQGKKARIYFLDVSFLNDRNEWEHFFDEVYPSDHYWKGVHMAAYGEACEKLLLELQKRDLIKKKVFFVENEIYATLATPHFPNAPRHHENHTIVPDGLFEAFSALYADLRLPPAEYRFLAENRNTIDSRGVIHALSDFFSGVGVVEQTRRMAEVVFPTYTDRLKWYYDKKTGLRSSNGVLAQRWQSPHIRHLIESYKLKLDPAQGSRIGDQEFFDRMRRNRVLRSKFMTRFEYIKAMHMGEFLLWLAHNQLHSDYNQPQWLQQTMDAYAVKTQEKHPDPIPLLNAFKSRVLQALGDDSGSGWKGLEEGTESQDAEIRNTAALKEILLRDPIFSNTRRQVDYKGPEKWRDLLKDLRDRVVKQLMRDFQQEMLKTDLGRQVWEKVNERPKIAAEKDEIFLLLLKNQAKGKERLKNLIDSALREVEKEKPVSELETAAWSQSVSDWLESLESRKKQIKPLIQFREKFPRILIGGRLFDSGGEGTFNEIKDFIRELDLSDRVVTIEFFNFHDAPLIYRAVSGTFLVSDEFLEALHTSGLKGFLNGAPEAMVYGGSGAELLRIWDRGTKTWVDMFDPSRSHDEIATRIELGVWEVWNGTLIEYAPYDLEQSRVQGGRRRPSRISMEQGMKKLKRRLQVPVSRMNLEFESLATPNVDIEKGQVRAHAFLWLEAVRKKDRVEKIFSRIRLSPSLLRSLLDPPNKEEFIWKRKASYRGGELVPILNNNSFGPGLFGFADSARVVRTKGKIKLKGEEKKQDSEGDGYESLVYHVTAKRADGGDIFYSLFNENTVFTNADLILNGGNRGQKHPLYPILSQLRQLQREAIRLGNKTERNNDTMVKINLEALDLIEKFAVHVSWEILRNYLTIDKVRFPKDYQFLGSALQDLRVVENISRYLERHAIRLDKAPHSDPALVSYLLPFEGRNLIVTLDLAEERSSPDKPWIYLEGRETLKAVLGEQALSGPVDEFRVTEFPSGETFPSHRVYYSHLPIGPSSRAQVILLEPKEETMFSRLSAAVKGTAVEPNELLRQEISNLPQDPETRKAVLSRIVDHSREEIVRRIGEDGIPPLMVFIAGLSPSLLEAMKKWDEQTYDRLADMMRRGNLGEVLEKGTIRAYETNQNGAVAFTRELDGRQVLVAIQFDQNAPTDAEGRRWFTISGLGPHAVHDHLAEKDYPQPETEKWRVGVPSFQVLEIKSPNRSEARSETREGLAIVNLLTALAQGEKDALGKAFPRPLGQTRTGGEFSKKLRAEARKGVLFYSFLLSRRTPEIPPLSTPSKTFHGSSHWSLGDPGGTAEEAYLARHYSTMA